MNQLRIITKSQCVHHQVLVLNIEHGGSTYLVQVLQVRRLVSQFKRTLYPGVWPLVGMHHLGNLWACLPWKNTCSEIASETTFGQNMYNLTKWLVFVAVLHCKRIMHAVCGANITILIAMSICLVTITNTGLIVKKLPWLIRFITVGCTVYNVDGVASLLGPTLTFHRPHYFNFE